MHLINVYTLALETFSHGQVPKYAILSHRWGKEELTFTQVSSGRKHRSILSRSNQGYQKLKSACKTAVTFNLRYLWIDTCCIDKTSSAELSEAINSMFRWYQNAEVCLAYLEDVHEVEDEHGVKEVTGGAVSLIGSPRRSGQVSFEHSVWFTRAWTLQELLAPQDVHFFNDVWYELGTKRSLLKQLSSATRIPRRVLLGDTDLRQYDVATKMSWASQRKATRTEDIAYSLFGVFDVNMPLLYGEGNKAFIRLQEEIIKRSLDRSFLLWGLGSTSTSLLAASPDDFLCPAPSLFGERSEYPFQMTNLGLDIELNLEHWEMNTYAATVALDCLGGPGDLKYCILLKCADDGRNFFRVGAVRAAPEGARGYRRRRITILREPGHEDDTDRVLYGYRILSLFPLTITPYLTMGTAVWLPHNDNDPLQCNFDPSKEDAHAYVQCQITNDYVLFILLSFDFDFNPVLCINNESLVASAELAGNLQDASYCDSHQWSHKGGAKVASLPQPGEAGPAHWLCKTVERRSAFRLIIPEFLRASQRLQVSLDIHFTKTNRDKQARGGMWEIFIRSYKPPYLQRMPDAVARLNELPEKG